MKALILAAGFGSRLAPLTDHCPKSLVPVNGKPILEKQIENLLENGIEDITVVSGYQAEILHQAISKKFPKVKLLQSTEYASTNNMYSAYLARKEMGRQEFLMMNADVFYDSSVISTLLSFQAPNAIVTDIGNYLAESMKVVEINGKLVKISKQIPKEEALGCSIDVYKFSPSGSEAFFQCCTDYIENKKELKLWSEVALNDILSQVDFYACPLQGRWLEIDNHEDLAQAERLFADE